MKSAATRLLILILAPLFSGCVALGGAATGLGLLLSGVGVVQRDTANEIAAQQMVEIQRLREAIERLGLLPSPPRSISEAARERELKNREPVPRGWFRRFWDAL